MLLYIIINQAFEEIVKSYLVKKFRKFKIKKKNVKKESVNVQTLKLGKNKH